MNILFYREAMASYALSHPEACPCIICRAVDGDEEAFMEVINGFATVQDGQGQVPDEGESNRGSGS